MRAEQEAALGFPAGASSEAPASAERGLFGHPKGLAFIVATETWERFSFYGMQALLVLYMSNYLLHPGAIEGVAGFGAFRAALESVTGPLSTEALATQIFGLYGGLTYITPIIGGVIGDSRFGRKRTVALGAIIMMIGHFLMAIEAAFLPALACLLTGCGLLKGNLPTQLGELYAANDRRRDGAFSLYYVGINAGAFVAPLLCGTLGELVGWHWGFGAAGVGMAVGLVIYLIGLPHMPADSHGESGEQRAWRPGDSTALAALLVMLVVASLFWTSVTQVWNTYSLWVRDYVARDAFGFTAPVTWFQSLNSLFVLAMAPVVMLIWRAQAKRKGEPIDLTKIAQGCAATALALSVIAASNLFSHGDVPMAWLGLFALISSIGYLHVAPVAIALFSRASPPKLAGAVIGIYYVSIFIGSTTSGWLGRFYETLPPAVFWFMHAAIAALASVVTLIFHRPLRHALRL